MTESISTTLTTLCGTIIPFYLSEAETSTYPYAVYDATYSRTYDKDGVEQKISGDVKLRIVADALSVASQNAELIKSAIASGMHSDTYNAILSSSNESCVDGIWTIELTYTIIQYQ